MRTVSKNGGITELYPIIMSHIRCHPKLEVCFYIDLSWLVEIGLDQTGLTNILEARMTMS